MHHVLDKKNKAQLLLLAAGVLMPADSAYGGARQTPYFKSHPALCMECVGIG